MCAIEQLGASISHWDRYLHDAKQRSTFLIVGLATGEGIPIRWQIKTQFALSNVLHTGMDVMHFVSKNSMRQLRSRTLLRNHSKAVK